jgi:hypothetical protein
VFYIALFKNSFRAPVIILPIFEKYERPLHAFGLESAKMAQAANFEIFKIYKKITGGLNNLERLVIDFLLTPHCLDPFLKIPLF